VCLAARVRSLIRQPVGEYFLGLAKEITLAFCGFFFNDTATTEIYTQSNTLSLHDALPI
jgi:hypothetical protein